MASAKAARHTVAVSAPSPIKGGVSRGFIIGWVAIVSAVAIGFGLAVGPLTSTSASVHVAHVPTQSISPLG